MKKSKLGTYPKYKTHYTNEINVENEGEVAIIAGWITVLRDKGKIIFIKIRDGEGIAQIVLKQDEVSEELWVKAKKLTIESLLTEFLEKG